jgi:thioredoxin-like negative regulator of GroEL
MSTIMTNHETHASVPAITDEAFEAEVMQAQFPILVDFSAGGCASHAD